MANWLPIVDFDGYEVSDDGRVRSLDRWVPAGPSGKSARFVTGRVLKLRLRPPRGYPMVTLGHSDKRYVHRLVLEAFVGPCPDGMECLHRNDDPTDNRLCNLRWGTRAQNLADRVLNGNPHNHGSKTHCLRGHEFTPENTYINPSSGSRQCLQCINDFRSEKNRRRRERRAQKRLA